MTTARNCHFKSQLPSSAHTFLPRFTYFSNYIANAWWECLSVCVFDDVKRVELLIFSTRTRKREKYEKSSQFDVTRIFLQENKQRKKEGKFVFVFLSAKNELNKVIAFINFGFRFHCFPRKTHRVYDIENYTLVNVKNFFHTCVVGPKPPPIRRKAFSLCCSVVTRAIWPWKVFLPSNLKHFSSFTGVDMCLTLIFCYVCFATIEFWKGKFPAASGNVRN